MNVEARSLKIENVFRKGTYVIPDYQREYDWDNAEVDEFLEDINETKTGDSYFIGHMVLEGEFNRNRFNVIDGQQRITTITIILSVIRDLFYKKNEINLAEGVNENYIFGKNRSNEKYVILENRMPYPVLQSHVQSVPDDKDFSVKPIKNGEKKIVKIYGKLLRLFDTYSTTDLEDLRDKILDLEVIFVAVSDEVDAFTIFETLNATGKDLTPLDLIKNQIFKLYPREPHLDEPSDSWKEILSNSDGRSLKFLNNFWSSRYKKVSNKKIYKEFINKIVKPKEDIKKFLQNLKYDSILYKRIILPKKSDWKNSGELTVFFSLLAITDVFGIEVANPILLGLLREYENKNISLKFLCLALKTIERYHFINNAILSNRSSGLDKMYAKYSRDIMNATDKNNKHSQIRIMIKNLNSKIPSIDKFDANFDEKLYFIKNENKQKKLVQYVLKKIERKAQNNNITLVDVSLEHIYPENPDHSWVALSDIKWIKNIGNLVLLDKGLNSKIGNSDYSNKKAKVLKESTLVSTKDVLQQNSVWDENTIKSRRDKLKDFTYKDMWK